MRLVFLMLLYFFCNVVQAGWQLDEYVDEFTDNKSVSVYNKHITITCHRANSSPQLSFSLRTDRILEGYYDADFRDRVVRLDYRFDDEPGEHENIPSTKDLNGVFLLYRPGYLRYLPKKMYRHKQFKYRVPVYPSGYVTDTIALDQGRENLKKVMDTCKK